MPDKLRVLHLVTWLNQGGIETWLVRYLKIVNSSQLWHADVLCRGENEGQLADEARTAGAEVFHLPLSSPSTRNAHRLADFLSKHRYDIVHCHLNALNALVVQAGKLADVPVVAMYHNERLYPQRSGLFARIARPVLSRYAEWLIRYSVRNASYVAPVSRAVMAELERIQGSPISQSSVLYLGTREITPLMPGERDRLRATVFQVEEGTKVVLHVGSFTHQKNHLGVIEAFEKLHQNNSLTRLVLVGTGPLFQEIQSRASQSAAKEAIRILGPRTDVEKLMQAADLFFLPSFHEGLPIVVMEAFAAGLPVVGSRIPSLVEAMGGETSSLAAPTDSAELARRLENVLTNELVAADLRELGNRRYRSDFSLTASTDRIHQVYSQLLSCSKTDHPAMTSAKETVRTF